MHVVCEYVAILRLVIGEDPASGLTAEACKCPAVVRMECWETFNCWRVAVSSQGYGRSETWSQVS